MISTFIWLKRCSHWQKKEGWKWEPGTGRGELGTEGRLGRMYGSGGCSWLIWSNVGMRNSAAETIGFWGTPMFILQRTNKCKTHNMARRVSPLQHHCSFSPFYIYLTQWLPIKNTSFDIQPQISCSTYWSTLKWHLIADATESLIFLIHSDLKWFTRISTLKLEIQRHWHPCLDFVGLKGLWHKYCIICMFT